MCGRQAILVALLSQERFDAAAALAPFVQADVAIGVGGKDASNLRRVVVECHLEAIHAVLEQLARLLAHEHEQVVVVGVTSQELVALLAEQEDARYGDIVAVACAIVARHGEQHRGGERALVRVVEHDEAESARSLRTPRLLDKRAAAALGHNDLVADGGGVCFQCERTACVEGLGSQQLAEDAVVGAQIVAELRRSGHEVERAVERRRDEHNGHGAELVVLRRARRRRRGSCRLELKGLLLGELEHLGHEEDAHLGEVGRARVARAVHELNLAVVHGAHAHAHLLEHVQVVLAADDEVDRAQRHRLHLLHVVDQRVEVLDLHVGVERLALIVELLLLLL